ncbi:MAG: tetratricopeptide repeat protein [Clostridia bacterium]|nr:tetratricopeptide repeat protein [Clostridia bacterium]
MKQVKCCGELLLERENFKKAAHIYVQAIKNNTNKPDLYYNLGIVYSRINEFSLAKECYKKAVELDSNLYNAYYRLGQISLLYRDIDSAEKYFMQSIDGEVELKAYYQLAKIYMMKNNKNKAAVFLNKATNTSRYYYDLACKEPIFFSIKQLISKPQDNLIKELKESKKEKNISEYLDNTYNLTKILNEKENNHKKYNS